MGAHRTRFSMAHDWKKKHFNKPVWCAQCDKFIWGLGKQGYWCTVCTFPVHPKCKDLVDTPCPGHKTNTHAKALERASEESNTEENRRHKPDNTDGYVPTIDEEEEQAPAKQRPRPLVTQSSVVRIDAGTEEVVDGAKSIEDVYTVGKELGRGAFSVVYEAKEKKGGGMYAVKIIQKKNVQQDLHRLAIEMNILKSVDHPNIIKLKDLFETDESLYIVTELVTGGELFDRIVGKGSYSEKDAAHLMKKLIMALEYLHQKDIVHRDLKPENLLLKSAEEDNEIKLADFGLSKIMGQEVMMQTACGTPGYVAPEVLKASGYGKEVDMWSAGVICYILLCGFPPFYHENIPLLFESIMKADYDYPAEYWDHISDDAIDFIDSLLVVDPKKRASATQALKHKWLTGNAPDTALPKVSGQLERYNTMHREMSRQAQPTSAEDDDPLGLKK